MRHIKIICNLLSGTDIYHKYLLEHLDWILTMGPWTGHVSPKMNLEAYMITPVGSTVTNSPEKLELT